MKQSKNLNLLKRIKTFKELIKNDSSFILQHKNLEPKEFDDLKLMGSPSDIVLILNELGEFSLSQNNCLILNLWKPSTLQESYQKGNSIYIYCLDKVPNVAENLLFFAESGSAEVFCYDTNFDPWKILIFDGLSLIDHNEKLHEFLKSENQRQEEDYFKDVTSIIEVFLH